MTDAPDTPEATAPPVPPQLSTVLQTLDREAGETVSLGDLVAALRDRSFTPLMVIFSAPNVFLFIPGSSVITGLPLIFIAWQLICGRPAVWLPGILSRRSLSHGRFSRLVSAALPWVMRLERLARPRFWPAFPLLAERTAGVAALIMAIFMFLPIPFANSMPAISVIFLALGIGERDGLWLSGGLLLAVLSSGLVAAILGGGVLGLLSLFS